MFVYADNAATTAVSKTALDAMLPALGELYGNPSSLHQKGREANLALIAARETVAKCLNAQPREIYFTGCGTESDNWAITEGARLGAAAGKRHIISDAIEHHAVLHTLTKLEKEGFEVTYLPVHENGLVRLEELAAAQAFYQLLLTEEAVTPASITAGDLRLAGGSRSEKAAQLVAEKRRAASPALVETDFAFCNIRKGEEDGSAQ